MHHFEKSKDCVHEPPASSNKLFRILAIDGGGVRGDCLDQVNIFLVLTSLQELSPLEFSSRLKKDCRRSREILI